MDTTQVIIVGAGPAGLMTALLLAQSGIRATLIERRAGTSIHPKSRGLNLRTMEILRALGLEEAVLAAGAGLAKNKYMLFVETLAGREIRRIADDDLMMQGELLRRWTPCTWTQCSQDQFESILADAALAAGADIRFGSELTTLVQDESGVTCAIHDAANDRDYRIAAQYLLACDGASSFVRRAVNIPLQGRAAIEHFVNIYFRADLKPLVDGRWFGICFVENAEVQGLFLPVDNESRWLFNVSFDPDSTPQSTFSHERCLELVRAAVGDSGLDAEILSAIPWQASALVVPRLREGRVFLVGDAAHIMPPAGAFGLNTAVQDAHNLAWKIATVLKGDAADSLLDSYEQERLPIAAALAHAAEREMERPHPWEDGGHDSQPGGAESRPAEDEGPREEGSSNPWDEPLEEQVRQVIGFQYRSNAVAQDEEVSGLDLRCQGGTRFPHAWMPDGRSTLDLITPQFTAVVPEGAELSISVPVSVRLLRLPASVWNEITGPEAGDIVLIRPDGIVAGQCAASQLGRLLHTLTAAGSHATASASSQAESHSSTGVV